MKTAVLTHINKHGTDTYVAQVPDFALEAEEIIKAMVKEFSVDYKQSTPEQDAMGEGETLELSLYNEADIPELSIEGEKPIRISTGSWRYSEEGEEVTTSHKGILEGKKRVCSVSNSAKTKAEVEANGMAISAVPEMLSVLRQIVTAADDLDNQKDRDLVQAIDWEAVRAALEKAGG